MASLPSHTADKFSHLYVWLAIVDHWLEEISYFLLFVHGLNRNRLVSVATSAHSADADPGAAREAHCPPTVS